MTEQVVVFATDRDSDLAALSNNFHFSWWTTKVSQVFVPTPAIRHRMVHDEQVANAFIRRLREIHVEIDEAVAEAYGFDLTLGHGFHQNRQGARFTIDPATQVEALGLLLKLNY